MNFFKLIAQKVALIGCIFLLSHNTLQAQGDKAAGKTLFQQNCQTCHALNKDLTGPALAGVTSRGPWTDRKELYKWVHNPPAYIASDKTGYTKGLQEKFHALMTPFPQLGEKDIDNLMAYIEAPPAPTNPTTTGTGAPEGASETSGSAGVIFGVISLILAIITLILLQVNSNLKKLSDDKEGIQRPEAVPFYRNKIYIAMLALVLFVVGGYFVGRGAIRLGRQQSYQPDQPIYFSHKIHAGVNQINCLYCHGNAWESKHAAIPSMNICMNCHKAINAFEKGPATGNKVYDEDGNEVNGTAEIKKLYQYAGYTEGQPWNPANAKPIAWVKIHNLPDHVYFNHSQHVRVGKVQCQTCHGPITEMDQVKQFAELSMGWCINCHRESKVDFNSDSTKGNQFYSIYEKFHNDIKNGKMDSVTVKDIGGIECQKCHY
jgi:mono/diheme cytochrome c family protein